MKKIYIFRLIIGLLFLVPLTSFIFPSPEIIVDERRKVIDFPNIPNRFIAPGIKAYFKQINSYFNDRFPLRSTMMTMAKKVFKNSSDNINLCLKGKDTWLFLGNGYADIIDKLQGGVKLSGLKLNRLTEKYVKIKEMSEIVGAEFYMFIGPNKSSVYPEYLPPIVFPSTQRYLSPLFKSLKEKGVDVYDPTLALIKAKQVSSTFFYYKTDTHWNSLGGYLAFEGFRELIGLPSLPPLSFIDGPPVNGDLINIGGYVNFPLSSATNDNPLSVWATPLNVIEEEQGLAINSNPISDKIVWIFGDSFNIALKPYFIAMFKEIHIFKHRNFEKIISSERPKPDLIVWIIVERNVDEI